MTFKYFYFVQSLKSRSNCSKVLAGHKVKDVSSVSFTYRTVRGETVFRCQIPNESDVLQRLFFFVLWEKKFPQSLLSLNCTHVIRIFFYSIKVFSILVAYCCVDPGSLPTGQFFQSLKASYHMRRLKCFVLNTKCVLKQNI